MPSVPCYIGSWALISRLHHGKARKGLHCRCPYLVRHFFEQRCYEYARCRWPDGWVVDAGVKAASQLIFDLTNCMRLMADFAGCKSAATSTHGWPHLLQRRIVADVWHMPVVAEAMATMAQNEKFQIDILGWSGNYPARI